MDPNVISFLPQKLKAIIERMHRNDVQAIEEIRIRIGRPIEIVRSNGSFFLTYAGQLVEQWQNGIVADQEDGKKILNLISRHSLYAIEEELRRGYVTVTGGHRVGIVGRAVVENGKIQRLKEIRSFNIRIAREHKGIGERILPYLVESGQFLSTILISPPRCGKTTLLRDLTRLLSEGNQALRLPGLRVGLVDERSEMASCVEGIPQNDLGPRVDVLDSCPKAEGMMLLIRSMSPDLIVTDEIGSEEDTLAIKEALYAGVKVMTTAHGSSIEDLQRRPNVHSLFQYQAFQRYVLLSNRQGAGTVEAIYNRDKNPVFLQTGGRVHA